LVARFKIEDSFGIGSSPCAGKYRVARRPCRGGWWVVGRKVAPPLPTPDPSNLSATAPAPTWEPEEAAPAGEGMKTLDALGSRGWEEPP
jgi:hypothetical protein